MSQFKSMLRSLTPWLVCLILAAETTAAEPTLDETVDFIRTKLSEGQRAGLNDPPEVSFSKEDCVLTFVGHFLAGQRIYKIHMADCDPNRVATQATPHEDGNGSISTEYYLT